MTSTINYSTPSQVVSNSLDKTHNKQIIAIECGNCSTPTQAGLFLPPFRNSPPPMVKASIHKLAIAPISSSSLMRHTVASMDSPPNKLISKTKKATLQAKLPATDSLNIFVMPCPMLALSASQAHRSNKTIKTHPPFLATTSTFTTFPKQSLMVQPSPFITKAASLKLTSTKQVVNCSMN